MNEDKVINIGDEIPAEILESYENNKGDDEDE